MNKENILERNILNLLISFHNENIKYIFNLLFIYKFILIFQTTLYLNFLLHSSNIKILWIDLRNLGQSTSWAICLRENFPKS